MGGPRFSIVIPCFNQGAFLHESLESALAQTRPAHEIIVVDDGSTDRYTVERIDALCKPPVRLVRQANRGLSGARNAGVDAASGDFIVPLDADDRFTPDALAAYADAIAARPEIDIWFPDLIHFGLDESPWVCRPFNAWHELRDNHMIYGSAIRRAVFDAGVRYNERMRRGYEDWEFFIHACCERNFRAAALRRKIFRYRRWGYSMLSASNEVAGEIVAQLRSERAALFGDPARLDELKRAWSPALAIATRDERLEARLAKQTLRDWRIADEWERARWILIANDANALAAAAERDPFLLEKLVRMLDAGGARVAALASWSDVGRAYPGELLPADHAIDGLRSIGVVAALDWLLEAKSIAARPSESGDELWRRALASGPGVARVWVVGSPATDGPALPLTARAGAAPTPATTPVAHAPKNGAHSISSRLKLVGQGLSRVTRGVIGPERHDRLWQRPPLSWLAPSGAATIAHHAPSAPPPSPPVTRDDRDDVRAVERAALHAIASEPPRYAALPATDGRGLMIFVPWMISGGADRSMRDLIQGLAQREPSLRIYVTTTMPFAQHWGPQVWADELLPLVRGWFSLPELGGADPAARAAELCERVGADAVLVMNSGTGFDALPRLKRLARPPRTVTLQHAFNIDPETGKRIGWPIYAASRYNNLLDGYAVTSRTLLDTLVAHYYVSPTKLHLIPLGADVARFTPARRTRLVAGERPTLLWLGRLSPEKNPRTALEVAKLWRERHPDAPLKLEVAGGGALAGELARYVAEHRLHDSVTLLGEISDAPARMRAADCLLITSLSEGIPVVLYEASAADLPFLTPTKNTSIKDDFSDEQAWFIDDATDAAEYVRVLEKLLASPDEARRRSARNWERRDEFDKSRYVERMHRLIFPES